MKLVMLAAGLGLAFAGLPATAVAACASPSVRVDNPGTLGTLLRGNTVCVPPVTQPEMSWQELHQASGALVDYKRGPTDAFDTSSEVGTWLISGAAGQAVVIHNYGSGGAYTFSVWNNGDGTYSFCSANPEVRARIKAGGGAC